MNGQNIIKEQKIDMLSTVGRHLGMLTTLICVGIIIAGYFILSPLFEEVQIGGRNNLATQEAVKTARAAELASLEQLISNYQTINQKDLEQLETILPTEKDVPGLLIQLQSIADQNSFSLTSVNINQEAERISETAKGSIKKLTLILNLVGTDYNGLKGFLEDLETNIRLFDVNAVYFNSGSNNYSINLFTYYFSPSP